MNTASLKQDYRERIVPILQKEFGYSSIMQAPKLEKIVLNQGLGIAVADKKIIEVAINEMTTITGQKAVATISKKDISNFKLRKKMPIGVRVTLRGDRMYEFLERLIHISIPRIRARPKHNRPSDSREHRSWRRAYHLNSAGAQPAAQQP